MKLFSEKVSRKNEGRLFILGVILIGVVVWASG